VTSPHGDVLHYAEKVTQGQFAFTTADSGIYLACFWAETLDRGMVINLNIDWRLGIAAKDWDSVAKKEKIDVSTVAGGRGGGINFIGSFPTKISYHLRILVHPLSFPPF
jgi:hypothetical protein